MTLGRGRWAESFFDGLGWSGWFLFERGTRQSPQGVGLEFDEYKTCVAMPPSLQDTSVALSLRLFRLGVDRFAIHQR
jgi:hypothetical protein